MDVSKLFFCCFFFQAEDGIRDRTVTGVQTCALPISGVVLQTDAEVADLVGRLDESPADIMIANNPQLEWQTRFLRISDRRRHARIGDRDDDVGIDRAFAREFLADALACLVDALPLDDAVGAREVNMLEHAKPAVAPAEG